MFTDENILLELIHRRTLYDECRCKILLNFESIKDDVYAMIHLCSKEDKNKSLNLLIDELDPHRSSDFLPSPRNFLATKKFFPSPETLLIVSSENEEKVFNPGILTSKGVHTSLLPELSHRGPKAFKVIKIFESPMEIFPCSYGEDIRILDVSWIAPDFEASRAHGFVLRSLELQILSFIMESNIANLSTNVLSLSILNKRLRIYVETLLKKL
ncbi:hypothetical protein Tco_0951818 [Tanacetum coccineum]|uniref:Uncharacterized protein n=1 Tax=Tanacetum coccineum TaxID=301880 RepID=A0ABQ5DVX9_9ASTR